MIGTRIRALREQIAMSQTELAERIPLSQKQVSRIERDNYVQLPRHTLIRIAEVLEIPLATGEVNAWLGQSAYAPLVRPGLPLPKDLEDWLAWASSLPVAVMDPAGAVRHHTPLFGQLWTHECRRSGNLTVWALEPSSPLGARDRRRLLAWHWGLLRYARCEPWVEDVEQMVARFGAQALALWDSVAKDTLLPADFSPSPWHLQDETLGELSFRVAISQPTWRPDLQVLVFHPYDARTRLWCEDHLADAAAAAGAAPLSFEVPG
jgi:transcriptional regulator with XRE-family HTH domain